MTYYLTLPNQATWEAFDWRPSECGQYANGPDGQFADIIGGNYYQHEDGTREPRAGYLVNIAGLLPEVMQQYALDEAPIKPKRVFLGG